MKRELGCTKGKGIGKLIEPDVTVQSIAGGGKASQLKPNFAHGM